MATKKSAFAKKLTRLRERLGLTKNRVAVETGLTRVCIGNLEAGRNLPDLHTFFKLCNYFKVDPVRMYRIVPPPSYR